MTKYLMIGTIFVLGAIAEAKTYHSEDDSAAVIYYMQTPEVVNALYCDEVDKSAARAIARSLKTDPNGFDTTKCQMLSESGITKASIAEKIPALKQQLTQALAAYSKMMGGMVQGMTGDSEAGKQVGDMFSSLTAAQKAQVEALDAESVFSKLVAEARSPLVKAIESKELEEEVETFGQLAE